MATNARMARWSLFASALVASIAIVTSAPKDARSEPEADVVGSNGTLSTVPGYAGATLKYRVAAVKTGDSAGKTAHAWFKLENPNAFEIKVVLCAMLSLHNKPFVTVPRTIVTKNAASEWECSTSGTSTQPPNYHFSCRRVTIPPGATIDVFDQAVAFSVPFEEKDLGAVYFDVLKDCPLKGCDIAKGIDQWVVPYPPTGHLDWANIWASGKPYEGLTTGGVSGITWPSGNWVTMGYPAAYPARLQGMLVGAPAGAVVQVSFAGVPANRFVVEPDTQRPPCGGREVQVAEDFTITEAMDALDGISVTVPSDDCGNVAEGSVVRFNAEVVAREGAEHYRPGDFMYGVDVFFVKDSAPPEIREVTVRPAGPSALKVDVAATDETTMAMGATFVYSADGAPAIEVPIGYADPASQGDVMLFSQEIGGLPTGVRLRYHVDVYDEVGNRASSEEAEVVLSVYRLFLPMALDDFELAGP